MPDVATTRSRTVQISGGGSFAIDSAAVFNPHYDIGAGSTPRRITWGAQSEVDYWGKSVWVEIIANTGGSGAPPGSISHPSITLTVHYGGFSKSITATGTAYTVSPYGSPVRESQQYFVNSVGTFTFLEVVNCIQHLNPNPYEVRTGTLFTCTASISAFFVDTLGSGSQTVSATVNLDDTEIAGFAGQTYSDYAYNLSFGGINVHSDLSANIAFDQPGLISTYSGINTYWGKPKVSGNGSGVTWHWAGAETDVNPDWVGTTGSAMPGAVLEFRPSWAMSAEAKVYHYRDATEVGAPIDHHYGTDHVGTFTSGGSYRYPASGLVHWLNLNSFDSGQQRDGGGFQPGSQVPSDSNYNSLGGLQGSNYGPVGLLLQVPGDPIGADTQFRIRPSWADGYGTYLFSDHPVPQPVMLQPKLWQPYQQGTIQWDATHRFTLFETGGTATYLTADASASDTLLHVASWGGFAVGDTIQVGTVPTLATATVSGVAAGQLTLTAALGIAFLAGTPVVSAAGRWFEQGPWTFPGSAATDPAPGIAEVAGTGIDGAALEVTSIGHAAVGTSLRYVLLHQGYRYARLRMKGQAQSTTLSANAAVGATDLAVTSEAGFVAGMGMVGTGSGGEVISITGVSPGHLTVAATQLAHASGSVVAPVRLAERHTATSAAVAAGATDLPVLSSDIFVAGQLALLAGGPLGEVVTISAISPGHLTVGATVKPYPAGTTVAPMLGGRVVFSLTGSKAGSIGWLVQPPLGDGLWLTREIDLAIPDYEIISGTWTPTRRWVPPSDFLEDPLPFGRFLGASVAVEPLDAGRYTFDYLEGYHKTDGMRTPVLLLPFLDGYGDFRDLGSYEPDPEAIPKPDQQQVMSWVVNGARGMTLARYSPFNDVTGIWSHLFALLDTAAKDSGIHVVTGTFGDPDLKMAFGPLNQGDYRFDSSTGYGLKPAMDAAYTVYGQLRPTVVSAYYGCGDLIATSGGYGDTVGFHLDWLFDGEAIIQAGLPAASLKLNDNDSGSVLATAATDNDGMARLPAKYGVYLPYRNVDRTAQWFQPPRPPGTTLTALVNTTDTVLQVADSSSFHAGDHIQIGYSLWDADVASVGPGTLTLTASTGQTFAVGDPVRPPLPPISYTGLGFTMNSYWLSGDITPTDPAGYWSVLNPPAAPVRYVIAILDRYQSFYVAVARRGLGVWNMHDRLGAYHRANVDAGKIQYKRSDTSTPPFVLEVDATAGPNDSQPRMAASGIERVELLFVRGSDVLLTWSDDDGATWNDPMTLFAGGTHPANAATDVGTVIHAAYVSGHIQAKEEIAPEQFSDPWTFVDNTGAVIEVDDDSFSFSLAKEGAARYVLVVSQVGDAAEYESADDCRTWTVVT